MPDVCAINGLGDIWLECVRRFPRKVAVIAGNEVLDYAQADARVRSLATELAGPLGVGRGDRVCIYMQNSLDFFLAYWAAHLAGAAVCGVSPRLGAREANHVIRTSGAKTIFCDTSPPLEDTGVEHCQGVEELRAACLKAQDSPSLRPGRSEELAVLAHTSGTTGEPKISEVTHSNLLFNLRTAIFAHSLRHEDVILVGGPMFHCTPLYSLMPSAAYLGATLVITPETSAAAQAKTAAKEGATVWFGVPTLFHQLAAAPGVDDEALSKVRLLAYAGSPMRPDTIQRISDRWPRLALHNFFGLTETISMTHVLPSCDALDRADSVGKVLPEVFVRIAGEGGEEAARGEVGELCFHRRNVIRAYWGKPGLLEKSFDGDWFRTGDLAREDEDGYLYLQGRSKDMIIVSGENVYAAEVEGVIARCPGVANVAVVGIAATGVRASLGELVKAVVVRTVDSEIKDLDVKRFCSKELASYKVPHIVEFRDELPCNVTGKVLKEELK